MPKHHMHKVAAVQKSPLSLSFSDTVQHIMTLRGQGKQKNRDFLHHLTYHTPFCAIYTNLKKLSECKMVSDTPLLQAMCFLHFYLKKNLILAERENSLATIQVVSQDKHEMLLHGLHVFFMRCCSEYMLVLFSQFSQFLNSVFSKQGFLLRRYQYFRNDNRYQADFFCAYST